MNSRLIVLSALGLLSLIGCGGGGSSGTTASSGTTSSSGIDISTRPALGCFSDGAKVEAYNTAGNLIGTGTVSSCDAAITLPAGHTGPLLLKALGAAGVTYFNEMDPDNPATFGAGSSMLSVLPSVQAGSVYGINVITNLVAAAAGIDADAPVAPVATKIATAKALTLGVLGLTEADLGGDIFAAPVALKNKTDKSLTGIISGKMLYATVLAELAASSTGSPATQAATLFTKMKSAATSNTGAATNLSAISQVMLKAVSNISSGKSTALQSFGASGYEVPSALATSYTAAVTTATQAIKTQTNETSVSLAVPGSTQTATSVKVVPAIGYFGAGAKVFAIDPTNGQPINSDPVLTDATGVASLNLGSWSKPFILKVVGDTSVQYYDAGLNQKVNYTGTDVLLALVPAQSKVTNGSSIGVTPLTHAAAAFVLPSLSNLQITLDKDQTMDSAMLDAMVRARYFFGLTDSGSGYAALLLNPLLAPERLSSSTDRIDLSKEGGFWGVYFAELSRSANQNNEVSFMAFVGKLFDQVLMLKAAQYADVSATAFNGSNLKNVMSTAAGSVSSGNKIFRKTSVCISEGTYSALKAMFLTATTTTKNNFQTLTRTQMDSMRTAFASSLNYQLLAKSWDLDTVTATTGCNP
jgi:hypothetical protein